MLVILKEGGVLARWAQRCPRQYFASVVVGLGSARAGAGAGAEIKIRNGVRGMIGSWVLVPMS